ncbi:MAG: hypothetical protein E7441_08610 [Ruminococcaceae bacterium]|nr:hypothetical protein [Oscillospiraceae bacterium]
MKKFLSIILATAMLISLIPAVFAADAETGIKVVYDFTDEEKINSANSELVEDTTRGLILDPAVFTYDATKGFWEYAEDSYNDNAGIARDKDTGVRLNLDNYCFQVASNKTTNTTAWWIAFKLYVPKTGTYALSTDVSAVGNLTSKKKSAVNAYIFTTESVAFAGDTIREKILAGINNEQNLVNTENLKTGTSDRQTALFDQTMPLTAGEHYFVFDPIITTGTTTTNICLYSLTLTENGTGTGNAIMGGKISGVSDTLEIDDTATVSAIGYLSSTGAEISDFTYSVEGDAVEIAGDTVTAKEAGTATIIATSASAVEGCNTITKTVKVVKQDEALTGAFIQESAKENITPSYVAPTVTGTDFTGKIFEADDNGNGTFTLTAPEKNSDDKPFLYWAKGMDTQKKIISFENVINNYVPAENGRNYLIAVYEGDIMDNTNEYYNLNGQLIAKQANAPAYPSIPGLGTAKEWKHCGGNIYVAEYAAAAPTANITITAGDNCTLDKTGKYAYGEKVTCTASGKGTFKCWKKNDEIVSIDESYTFHAWEDCTVEAVYEDHYYTGSNMKIIIDSFDIDTGVTGVMAEFIGLDSAVEKGIMFTDSEENTTKIAMTTKDSQFTVTADKPGTYVGYAILKSGVDAYTLITDGEYAK